MSWRVSNNYHKQIYIHIPILTRINVVGSEHWTSLPYELEIRMYIFWKWVEREKRRPFSQQWNSLWYYIENYSSLLHSHVACVSIEVCVHIDLKHFGRSEPVSQCVELWTESKKKFNESALSYRLSYMLGAHQGIYRLRAMRCEQLLIIICNKIHEAYVRRVQRQCECRVEWSGVEWCVCVVRRPSWERPPNRRQ